MPTPEIVQLAAEDLKNRRLRSETSGPQAREFLKLWSENPKFPDIWGGFVSPVASVSVPSNAQSSVGVASPIAVAAFNDWHRPPVWTHGLADTLGAGIAAVSSLTVSDQGVGGLLTGAEHAGASSADGSSTINIRPHGLDGVIHESAGEELQAWTYLAHL